MSGTGSASPQQITWRRAWKGRALAALARAGLFEAAARSRWRQERLLILAYHGVALDDEHLWNPSLYVSPDFLRRRLDILREEGSTVLPLGEALRRLWARQLPPRSVALTFDDGTQDFHARAWPILRTASCPVMVYLTSYYSVHQMPVFDVCQDYLLWRARGRIFDGHDLGLLEVDLRTERTRNKARLAILRQATQESWGADQKDAFLAGLASVLGLDYAVLKARRLLQVMNPEEVAEVACEGAAVELHTHRHRVPDDRELFRREIEENRDHIRRMTGRDPTHFCYPGGVFHEHCVPWLRALGVTSATTTIPAYATATSESLLLPRFIDSGQATETEFRAWITGAIRFIGRGGGSIPTF